MRNGLREEMANEEKTEENPGKRRSGMEKRRGERGRKKKRKKRISIHHSGVIRPLSLSGHWHNSRHLRPLRARPRAMADCCSHRIAPPIRAESHVY